MPQFLYFFLAEEALGAGLEGQLAGQAEDALAAAGSAAQIGFTGLIGDGKIKPNQSAKLIIPARSKL